MIINGSLDILVQRSGVTGQGKISFIQNNVYYDAFFLKAIGLLTLIRDVACH